MNSQPQALSLGGASFESQRRPSNDLGSGDAIIAAHGVTRDCLVILARSERELPAEGLATLSPASGESGRFRALSWASDEDPQRRWYLAAVRVAAVGATKRGDTLLLQSGEATGPVSFALPDGSSGTSFAAELRNRAKSKLSFAVKFLLETFSSRASRQISAVSAFLAATLDCASQEGGVIETLGPIEGQGLLLQGWSGQKLSGRLRLLVLGDVLDEYEASCASFPRADLEGRGVGMLSLVQPHGELRLAMLRSVYLRGGERYFRLSVLPNATRLGEEDAANHLRSLLPMLPPDEHLQKSFGVAVRPRFMGVDTVSTLSQPVRMAVDLAVLSPGIGWYLTGWMLDPAKLVAEVTLHDTKGTAERLDQRWTRLLRADVSAGHRDDPLFQGTLDHDEHGFTVFVPSLEASAQSWIELQLADGQTAFMPLRALSGEGTEIRRRLLESVDLHKSSAAEIIEQHLAPFFHAAKSLPRRRIGHRVLRASTMARMRDTAALIIPLIEGGTKSKIVVSELASRHPGKGLTPIFVCSSTLGDGVKTLLREVAFYGLDAEILLADAPVDFCEALDMGVHASDAARFVVMAPSTHPLKENWATALLAAVPDADEPVVATPTLLYEDWSIAYAGIDGIRFFEAAPFADATYARAGYPREAVASAAITPTLAGSLDCCAMTRAAYDRLEGFAGGYASDRANALDLFLRLRKAGARMLWTPQLEAYSLSEQSTPSDHWIRTGELVDGWGLRASWKDRLPAITGAAAPEKAVEPPKVGEPANAAKDEPEKLVEAAGSPVEDNALATMHWSLTIDSAPAIEIEAS